MPFHFLSSWFQRRDKLAFLNYIKHLQSYTSKSLTLGITAILQTNTYLFEQIKELHSSYETRVITGALYFLTNKPRDFINQTQLTCMRLK